MILAEEREVRKLKSWSEPQAEAKAVWFLEEVDQVTRASFLAAARTESLLWSHTLSTPTIGIHLNSESLRIALALRVEADVCEPHM